MKILRKRLYSLYKRFNQQLSVLESRKVSNLGNTITNPPLFIIGPPRSGTTLIYQILTSYFKVGYLANIHHWIYGAPFLAEKLFHPAQKRKKPTYSFRRGYISGLYSPSEAAEFWYRFFPRYPHYITGDTLKATSAEQLHTAMSALYAANPNPWLFKNLHCGMRIRALKQVFPKALFIIVDRDELNTARSILAMRKKVWDDYHTWWSVEPPNAAQIKELPPEKQAVEQIRSIKKTIREDIEFTDPESAFTLSYEDFCHNIPQHLRRIKQFYRVNGYSLNEREVSDIPDHLENRSSAGIQPELEERLQTYFKSTPSI